MKRALHPADVVITAYYAIISVIVLAAWGRIERPWVYLLINAAVVGVNWLLAYIDDTRESRLFRLLHHWYPIVAVLGAFRMLKYLVPEVHPFDDLGFDRALAALDQRWFGDVFGFWRRLAWPPLIDVLHVCYWSYFILPIILGIGLWRRGEMSRFREVVTVLLVAWYLSYLGYVAVPAVGPHHAVDGPRDPAFDGWFFGGPAHRFLMLLEGRMPDAFPSGHALIAMVALLLAWRHHRALFWWLLPFAAGLWLATMALRYHYVVDVVGSIAILPVAMVGGRWLFRRLDDPRYSSVSSGTA